MADTIRVTILDFQQSAIDGYLDRLTHAPGLEVVATLRYGEQLWPSLKAHPTDVLVLDFSVPRAAEDQNAYPTLTEIPKLLQEYPNLDVLMISMFAERGIIRAVMEAGASGYILKDDSESLRNLPDIISSVAEGGIYLSAGAGQLYPKRTGQSEPSLTPRQLEVLLLCAAFPGSTTAQLAAKMGVSNSTVRSLLSGAYMKLDSHTRPVALERARQLGLLTLEVPTTRRD